MQRHGSLAETSYPTRIVMCGQCSDIHLSIGPMTFRLNREAFDQLTHTIAEAAVRIQSQEDEESMVQQGVGSHWLSRKMSAC